MARATTACLLSWLRLSYFLPFFLALVYTLVAPFAKVEESFSLQAAHDFLLLGPWRLAAFDHLTYPGVVPRSCLGAAVLSVAALPAKAVVLLLGAPRLCLQVAVRGTLAACVGLAYVRLLRAAEAKFGIATASAAAVVVSITPHYLFYASRTLPNTFASFLMLHAFTDWLRAPMLGSCGYSPHHIIASMATFVTAVVIFRCDMLILLGCVALAWLAARRVTLLQLFGYGFFFGAVALAATVVADSWFWRRWLWPEGVVLLFNTVHNGSVIYGVSPWHWYWTSAIPRALLGTAIFAFAAALPALAAASTAGARAFQSIAGLATRLRADWAALELLLPALGFVALYSLLPHKELRFILPALPLLHLAAGHGLARWLRVSAALLLLTKAERGTTVSEVSAFSLVPNRAKPLRRRLREPKPNEFSGPPLLPPPLPPYDQRSFCLAAARPFLGALGLLAAAVLLAVSAAGTLVFVRASAYNYAGGTALQRLHSLVADDVHARLQAQAAGTAQPPSLALPVRLLANALPPCPAGDAVSSFAQAELWRRCTDARSGCFFVRRDDWVPPVVAQPTRISFYGALVPSAGVAERLAGALTAGWGVTHANWPTPANFATGDPPVCLRAIDTSRVPLLHTLVVHIDVAAAEMGVSRFGEAWSAAQADDVDRAGDGTRSPGWRYDKTEGLTDPQDFAPFDFLIAENASFHAERFDVVETVDNYERLDWQRLTLLGPALVLQPRLYIMRRREIEATS